MPSEPIGYEGVIAHSSEPMQRNPQSTKSLENTVVPRLHGLHVTIAVLALIMGGDLLDEAEKRKTKANKTFCEVRTL